jgi:hypothetical protein
MDLIGSVLVPGITKREEREKAALAKAYDLGKRSISGRN